MLFYLLELNLRIEIFGAKEKKRKAANTLCLHLCKAVKS